MPVGNSKLYENGISSNFLMFTPQECVQITDWAIHHGESHHGLVHTRQKASKAPLRRCKEYLVQPDQIVFKDGSSVSERVCEGFALGNIWGLSYREVPSIRVMEYQIGDGYGLHTDWSFGAARERKISMTCQLTSHYNYKGGRVFLHAGPDQESISGVQGAATFWPSWTLHQVEDVQAGVRYALTAWAHGEEFR